MSSFVTRELVEETLRVHKNNPIINVVEIDFNVGAKKGDNYQSEVFALLVTTETNGVKEQMSLFAKSMPEAEARIRVLEIMQSFPKEATVYKKIFPDLIQLQKRRGVRDIIVPSAPVLFTDVDKAKRVLIFENIQTDGYRMADKIAGLDYPHCRLVMQELAKLHALSYALRKDTGKSLGELYPIFAPPKSHNTEGADKIAIPPHFQMFVNSSVACADVVENLTVDGRFKALAEKMRKVDVMAVAKVMAALSTDEKWFVLAHGDFWINNMLFKYSSDSSEPQSAKFVDFQIVRFAAPTTDLLYFFYTSTVRSDRRLYMDKLLQEYHATLQSVLEKLNIKFEEFTLENLKSLMSEHRLYGYIMACFTMPMMLARPEEAVSMDELNIEKDITAGFQDQFYKAFHSIKNSADFRKRLLEMAEEMEEYGVL